MNKSIKHIREIVLIILIFSSPILGQTLLLNKKGEFRVVNWSVHGMSGRDFTKDEISANYKKLVSVAEIIRNNHVMKDPQGFDCDATLYGASYDKNTEHGIPCNLAFNFCYFYTDSKGKSQRASIEPPHWDIEVNRIRVYNGGSLGYVANKPSSQLPKTFSMAEFEKAAASTREMFYVPELKENICPGIDRYGDDVIYIYNQDRPPYWVNVTLREVFKRLIDYWEMYPDQTSSEMTVKILKDERALYSESELDGYAYLGGRGPVPLSGVGNDSTKIPVMRVNPEYWNKSLPRSAVQILALKCDSDKNRIKGEMEEKLKNNAGTYHISRFLNTLDIKTLLIAIDK